MVKVSGCCASNAGSHGGRVRISSNQSLTVFQGAASSAASFVQPRWSSWCKVLVLSIMHLDGHRPAKSGRLHFGSKVMSPTESFAIGHCSYIGDPSPNSSEHSLRRHCICLLRSLSNREYTRFQSRGRGAARWSKSTHRGNSASSLSFS